MSRSHDEADVAIIGYGPSGVSAANFLGARGVRAVAFERAQAIYPRARAVTVDDWTMRCYQSVGLDGALLSVMDKTVALRWITYAGQELRRVRFPPGEMGFARSYAIYQPAMEDVLRQGAARYADHVQVRFGAEVVDVRQDADGVEIVAADVATGERTITRARYALACDGGSSLTRERLGVPLLGDTLETRWVVIDAKVKRWWPNREILTFWSDSERPVVDIALAMGNHRWELPLRPEESEADFQTHDQLWRLLATMGVVREDVEIHQHAFYKHHIRKAERWRDGRVLLLGDAAHLMPPWAGQGMQSGVRDAYTLSWKLAEVLAGRLPDAVLDTYQVEREPDVERCTQMSIGLGRIIKRELSEAEMAAMAQQPGTENEAAPPPPAPRIAAGWLTGGARAANALGRMIPQPRVATPDGRLHNLDAAIGSGFVLLGDGIDPRVRLNPHQHAQWNGVQARYFAIRSPSAHTEGPDELVDLDGVLLGWMRRYKAQVVALRPDHFVAAVDPGSLSLPGAPEHAAAVGQAA